MSRATATASRGRAGGATKGERTRARILDAAEAQFAEHGFEAASLREIAREAGIQQPGLYNHFQSKQALYAAVLDRALTPMADALERHLAGDASGPDLAQLPSAMTDLLCRHPRIAALFQDALRGDPGSAGVRMLQDWLDRLFAQGLAASHAAGVGEVDRADLAIRIIAMFNLCTGYFLSQRAFESMAEGSLTDPENIARQKRLLARLAGAVMPGAD